MSESRSAVELARTRLLTLLIVVASCVWSCGTGQKLIEDRPDWSVTRG